MRHYEILTKWWFFQIFSKKWWLSKNLVKIDDSSKSWQKLRIFQTFGNNLKNHHFYKNIENSSFFLPKLRKIFILCQNFKKSSFFSKILKKASFFPQNLKNYHFYQSLIVSHKYPILVSISLVSNSIQYWYQILACLVCLCRALVRHTPPIRVHLRHYIPNIDPFQWACKSNRHF